MNFQETIQISNDNRAKREMARETIARLGFSLVFIACVMAVQLISPSAFLVFAVITTLLSFFVTKSRRMILIMAVLYGIGYWLSTTAESFIVDALQFSNIQSEARIVLVRFSLVGFILPLALFAKLYPTQPNYFAIGNFTRTIYFPFIWKGIKDPIWRFLLVSTAVMTVLSSFWIDFQREDLPVILMYGVLFAVVNSTLEEILWRGLVLPRFVDFLGEKLGLVIASLGFGLYHYSIGFSWFACLLFTLPGIVMGGLVIRSRGLAAVILFHIVSNLIMILSGMIF
ncbi:MAG: CPBP family intramembrane metalloprotease [Caldilineaceae bacterium]|nr:CPBP family intramembrane metalloprotease [Caldilineaceae bacterium]